MNPREARQAEARNLANHYETQALLYFLATITALDHSHQIVGAVFLTMFLVDVVAAFRKFREASR